MFNDFGIVIVTVGVFLALVLVLVKCYDNEMVKATPHLFHPFVDSASDG